MSGAPGSFQPLSKLRERAEGDRDERLAKEEEERQRQKDAEAAEKAKKDAKDAQPEPIVHGSPIHGQLTEKELFDKYPSIVEQVKQKNYMLQGFAVYDFKVGGTSISLRTLRKSEQRVVSLLSEGELDEQGMQIYHPDDLNRWSLVFSLAKIGGQNMEPIAVPKVNASRRFVDETNKQLKILSTSDEVVKRLDILDNWSTAVFQIVLGNYIDINETYRRAILKDMQNPS